MPRSPDKPSALAAAAPEPRTGAPGRLCVITSCSAVSAHSALPPPQDAPGNFTQKYIYKEICWALPGLFCTFPKLLLKAGSLWAPVWHRGMMSARSLQPPPASLLTAQRWSSLIKGKNYLCKCKTAAWQQKGGVVLGEMAEKSPCGRGLGKREEQGGECVPTAGSAFCEKCPFCLYNLHLGWMLMLQGWLEQAEL